MKVNLSPRAATAVPAVRAVVSIPVLPSSSALLTAPYTESWESNTFPSNTGEPDVLFRPMIMPVVPAVSLMVVTDPVLRLRRVMPRLYDVPVSPPIPPIRPYAAVLETCPSLCTGP